MTVYRPVPTRDAIESTDGDAPSRAEPIDRASLVHLLFVYLGFALALVIACEWVLTERAR